MVRAIQVHFKKLLEEYETRKIIKASTNNTMRIQDFEDALDQELRTELLLTAGMPHIEKTRVTFEVCSVKRIYILNFPTLEYPYKVIFTRQEINKFNTIEELSSAITKSVYNEKSVTE